MGPFDDDKLSSVRTELHSSPDNTIYNVINSSHSYLQLTSAKEYKLCSSATASILYEAQAPVYIKLAARSRGGGIHPYVTIKLEKHGSNMIIKQISCDPVPILPPPVI